VKIFKSFLIEKLLRGKYFCREKVNHILRGGLKDN